MVKNLVAFSRNLEAYLIHLASYLICNRMLILCFIDSTVSALTKDESEFKMYIVQSIST